jgi:hypothetical protein
MAANSDNSTPGNVQSLCERELHGNPSAPPSSPHPDGSNVGPGLENRPAVAVREATIAPTDTKPECESFDSPTSTQSADSPAQLKSGATVSYSVTGLEQNAAPDNAKASSSERYGYLHSFSNALVRHLPSSLQARIGMIKADRRPWKSSLIRFGPLSGIFCMILALSSIIASLGVLAGSDRVDVDKWPTPPSTFLAILTALANLSVRYACIQGMNGPWPKTLHDQTNTS